MELESLEMLLGRVRHGVFFTWEASVSLDLSCRVWNRDLEPFEFPEGRRRGNICGGEKQPLPDDRNGVIES